MMKQMMIHDSYIDLSKASNRRKYFGVKPTILDRVKVLVKRFIAWVK